MLSFSICNARQVVSTVSFDGVAISLTQHAFYTLYSSKPHFQTVM